MSSTKDFPQSSTGWIHDLARAEGHPDAERLLGLGSSHDPHQMVEEETVRFLSGMREKFTEYCRLFNSYSEAGARFQDVKVYAVAQTAADFMLYRSQVKFVISNTAHGVIALAFAQHARTTFGFDGANPEAAPRSQELLAQIGPFRDVKWTFQGEEVRPEQIAKFYFSEFIRATRERKASTGQNQALLDQIKALLNDKGLQI
ncbi:MAG: hypothetical protein H7301_03365 [Cryobacterium sp.]|nr:hypothetical protein [Oligoflexia bacterium]